MSKVQRAVLAGRKKELKVGLAALRAGKHVFVHGPYGIGKTTFAWAVLSQFGGPRLSISMQESPSEMAEKIHHVLSHYKPGPRPATSTASRIYFWDRRTRIKSFRALKKLMDELCVYRFPIVVDDFRKITTSKLAFLNMLASMGFRFILALDNGYEARNLESLKKACPIFVWIDLPRLGQEESKELILGLFREAGAVPDQDRVRLWLQTSAGHPLTLSERVRRYIDSSSEVHHGVVR